MKATVMYGAKDVRVETVPNARLVEPTGALVTDHHAALTARVGSGVFDRVTDIDGVPNGYRAMNDREAIKVMIAF